MFQAYISPLLLFVALAVLHTWPLASDPAHLSRLDNNDTAFNTWILAWVAYQLPRDPLNLFQAPIFYPEVDTLAYSEHLIAQSVIGAPLLWLDWSPVLVYNVLVMLGMTLSALSMSLLMRHWTGSATAGIVAGSLFVFNAHLLTRFSHIQAQYSLFVPLALYALDRLSETVHWRHAVLLGLAFVAQALCSSYTMVFLSVALIAAVIVRPDGWLLRPRQWWPRAIIAGVGAAAILAPLLMPYYRVHEAQGLTRSIGEVQRFSATWRDYLATAGRLHYELWSHRVFANAGTALFPGMTALALVLVSLASGRAFRDRRARMALAFGIVGFALSFGPAMPGFVWLHEHVPLFQGIRAAARWGLLLLTALAILAGFGVQTIAERVRRPAVWAVLSVVLVALVTVEAARTSLALVPYTGIPRAHDRLREEPWGPLVIFPLHFGGGFHLNGPYLIHQTRHFRPMVNGYSSFAPGTFHARAARLQGFPLPEALAELRQIGVTHVLLYREALNQFMGVNEDGMRTLDRMPEDFTFVAEEDGVLIYRLLPRR